MSEAPERVGEHGDEVNEEAIGPGDVSVPGPYPSGQVSEHGDTTPETTKTTREAGSLGDLTREVSTSTVADESGGMGSPLYDEEERKNK
jgi:hypothetical protein